MKVIKMFAAIALVAGILTACNGQLSNNKELPEPFKARITTLVSDQIDLSKKKADLEKQLVVLTAQCQWDNQQIEIASSEAIRSLGYNSNEYRVDVQKMKIVPASH